MSNLTESRTALLFKPFVLKNLVLPNRIVMAPMTRTKSPEGIPGPDVAAYYRRRAEGGVGLIVTEGTYVPVPSAGFYPLCRASMASKSLAGWKRVVGEVHQAGGKIFPQLWHVGLTPAAGGKIPSGAIGPSGLANRGEKIAEPMTQPEIDDVVRAFGQAALSAQRLGFDGVEITARTAIFWISSSGMGRTSGPTRMAAIWWRALASRWK